MTGAGSSRRRADAPQESGLSILKDNLEAIAIAIVMALVIRHFCVEAFEIPTRSMEPTLHGAQDHDNVGDRILVDKSAYLFTRPQRWDVMVFRYPLDRSRNFIKRLIGLPGERLRIGSDGGDIWIQGAGKTAFEIARKRRRVRDSLYHPVYPPDPAFIPREPARAEPDFGQGGDGLWAYWRANERARKSWDLSDDNLMRFLGGDQASLASRNPITTSSTPRSWHHALHAATRVRDLRVAGTVTVQKTEPADGVEGAKDLAPTELVVRWQPDERFEYGMTLRSESAGRSQAWIRRDGGTVAERTIPVHLVAGQAMRFELEAVDGDLRVWIDETEVVVLPDGRTIDDESSSNTQELAWEASGAPMDLTAVRIDRDLVYGNSWSYVDSAQEGVAIPEDSYFMLGDNTGSSSDSRKWQVRTVRLKDGTKIEYDNNPGSNNPWRSEYDADAQAERNSVRDIWGIQRSWLEDDEVGGSSIRYAPFVSRDLIVGRSFLIFWPLYPDFPRRLRFIR